MRNNTGTNEDGNRNECSYTSKKNTGKNIYSELVWADHINMKWELEIDI